MLVEVKGGDDSLKPEQREAIQQLERLGIAVKVERIPRPNHKKKHYTGRFSKETLQRMSKAQKKRQTREHRVAE